jgi:hypothetical protein
MYEAAIKVREKLGAVTTPTFAKSMFASTTETVAGYSRVPDSVGISG